MCHRLLCRRLLCRRCISVPPPLQAADLYLHCAVCCVLCAVWSTPWWEYIPGVGWVNTTRSSQTSQSSTRQRRLPGMMGTTAWLGRDVRKYLNSTDSHQSIIIIISAYSPVGVLSLFRHNYERLIAKNSLVFWVYESSFFALLQTRTTTVCIVLILFSFWEIPILFIFYLFIIHKDFFWFILYGNWMGLKPHEYF